MIPSIDRWEQGSEFHWLDYEVVSPAPTPWDAASRLYGSGQDAFRALLHHGQIFHGWRRFWIPSYFCQQVVEAFLSTGIEVHVYPCGPVDEETALECLALEDGDVVLVLNFFGLGRKPCIAPEIRSHFVLVEDHTHDPWSHWAWHSQADWCVASLRKTLPIPDGGVLWSPYRHDLPAARPVSQTRYVASLEKLTAMTLKRLYLTDHPVDKAGYRRLEVSGESGIVFGRMTLEISGMPAWTQDLLGTFPVVRWRKAREENHKALVAHLSTVPWLVVLQPTSREDYCPFSGILVFDTTARCDYIRRRLIASGVYPAVLWPLDETVVSPIPPQHVDFSRRMLSVHCDMRYTPHMLDRVANLVVQFGNEYSR